MEPVLDIVALRSLTAIADTGGFHRAALALHLSQSAISQHVRRLEKAIGRPLVQREGRGTRFTSDGALLLGAARTILAAHDDALDLLAVRDQPRRIVVVGATEHAADLILPAVREALQQRLPGCEVRFRIDRGARLREGIERGTVDVAILLGRGESDGAGRRLAAGALPLAWFAAPQWRPAATLSVVAIDDPCTIRRRALDALAEHRIAAAVVCDSGHLAGVVNAARAGLGVALLARVGEAPAGLEQRLDLPAVAPEPLHVRASARTHPDAAQAVADATRAVVGVHSGAALIA